MHVEMRRDRVGCHFVIVGEKRRDLADRRFVVSGDIDLRPVAGGEHGDLLSGAALGETVERRFDSATAEIHPLAQIDRRGAMAQADDEQPDAQKLWLLVRKYPTGTRFSSTIAKPTVDSQAARRPLHPKARRA